MAKLLSFLFLILYVWKWTRDLLNILKRWKKAKLEKDEARRRFLEESAVTELLVYIIRILAAWLLVGLILIFSPWMNENKNYAILLLFTLFVFVVFLVFISIYWVSPKSRPFRTGNSNVAPEPRYSHPPGHLHSKPVRKQLPPE